MISEPEWQSIRTMVERVVAEQAGVRRDWFVTGKVTKVDTKNKCIFMKEFGDQKIPIVGFDYEVKYYDETPKGTTTPAEGAGAVYRTITKVVKVSVVMPKKGDTVLVARELGTRRLPRCLGVIQGKNWIVPEVD